MLKIQNLSKKFGGVRAIDDCFFEIEAGKITALVGPNGSGKTTLFNLISGIEKPEKGKIFFNGTNITGYSIEQVSNFGISRVFQQSKLFKNLTVRENLRLAIDNEDTKFWKSLFWSNKLNEEKEIEIKEILDELGISKIINKRASDLSFGQKKLVELARALLNSHHLLMLDEPVAGVNPKIKKNIAKLLLKLKKEGQTILLIEHDMSFTASIADRMIVMDSGRVIAHGSPSEIKNNQQVLAAYL
jgi:branched-chain amino acid transport system ATP-binding protein/neutral amino acid transport system ATP-binding protein